jgi:hypothetical protein
MSVPGAKATSYIDPMNEAWGHGVLSLHRVFIATVVFPMHGTSSLHHISTAIIVYSMLLCKNEIGLGYVRIPSAFLSDRSCGLMDKAPPP